MSTNAAVAAPSPTELTHDEQELLNAAKASVPRQGTPFATPRALVFGGWLCGALLAVAAVLRFVNSGGGLEALYDSLIHLALGVAWISIGLLNARLLRLRTSTHSLIKKLTESDNRP